MLDRSIETYDYFLGMHPLKNKPTNHSPIADDSPNSKAGRIGELVRLAMQHPFFRPASPKALELINLGFDEPCVAAYIQLGELWAGLQPRTAAGLVERAACFADVRDRLQLSGVGYCLNCDRAWVGPCLAGEEGAAEAAERLGRRAALMAALGVKHLLYLQPSELPWFVEDFLMHGDGSAEAATARVLRDRALSARLVAAGVDPDAARLSAAARTFIVTGAGDVEAAAAAVMLRRIEDNPEASLAIAL